MENAFNLILLLSFGFITGVRHGIDFDHIAAITDITSSQPNRPRGVFYAMLYALGHGVMVTGLGVILITVGQQIPESIDQLFGKIVGTTLILLGLYVLYSLFRHGNDFRIRSRWMLIFDAIKFGYHKLLHNFKLSHYHPKAKEEKYVGKTAFTIGLIHGVGAETPTQVAALAALIGIGAGIKGYLFLLLFVLGIFLSNLVFAIFSTVGYREAQQKRRLYVFISSLTALFSLIVGTIFLTS